MPVRRYSPGETAFGTVSVRSEKKESSRLLVKVAGTIGAASIGLFFAGGLAHADTTVDRVGGNGDPNADITVNAAIANGTYDPNVNNIVTNYSATVMPEEQSVQDGASKVVGAYYNHGSGDFTCEGFSLGAIVCDAAGEQIVANNGGQKPNDYHATTIGNADAQSGAFQSPFARMAAPLVGPMMDVNMNHKPVPGTVNRFNVGDVWGNGNQGDNLGAGIDQLVHLDQHSIPNPNDPHDTYVGPDGVINEVYGQGNIGPNVANPAQQAPEVNVAAAPVPPAPAPAAAPVHLSAPEFFGEQPCFAEDGSQYWTPGTAPC